MTQNNQQREHLLGQRGCIVWLTGLSGAGKTTIAQAVDEWLCNNKHFSYVLDGDVLRKGLNRDLGFSREDRQENVRRMAETAALFANAGVIVLVAIISPYIVDRIVARVLAGNNTFLEVYVSTDLAECERRDPKGLYKKARAGEITQFTGIDAPYEPPCSPELVLDTTELSVEESRGEVVNLLKKNEIWDQSFVTGGI